MLRKAVKRVPEGEDIHHLNIMPMMDMMTILLVFLIKQAALANTPLNLKDVDPPNSLTQRPVTEQVTQITVGRTGILVDGIPVVAVSDGDVDASEKRGGSLGLEITRLSDTLARHREMFKAAKAEQGDDPGKVEPEELTLIADKETPYRLLFSVMYTARQSCQEERDCYRTFRLLVRSEYTDAALEQQRQLTDDEEGQDDSAGP